MDSNMPLNNVDCDATEQLNAKVSLLLRLPAELREHIWLQAVVDNAVLDIIHPAVGHSRKPSVRVLQPSISKTCRQARRETIPLFYKHNTFQLHCALKFKVRNALENISPSSSPGWLLKDVASEVQLLSIMQYSYAAMENFGTARRWLTALGKENREYFGSIQICCLAADACILREMATMRFDYKSLQVLATRQPVLIENWQWDARDEGDETEERCRATACANRYMPHKYYKIRRIV
ncbi:hypothetical protein DOTSEDRAFT_69908 [Dothistroma septosporum NZE10]|uniref:2EXR domain-containing protein n=1 Tax=Dothistroma septosporum (strain NZE10 / CBS 128990) TaxID=675120 RepID=N1PX88_DOTSN|nr:hypothetical protein DOTSEDRAFT_69908 [Dothistroma septosporum NZE10]